MSLPVSERDMSEQIIVAVDFECLRPNCWSTFAVVVMGVDVRTKQMNLLWKFSVGQLEEQIAFERELRTGPTAVFWRNNHQAYDQNMLLNVCTRRAEAERAIVANINRIRQRWSRFWLICDNPSMDIRILDNILLSHGADPICIRPPNNTYMQVICSWSYRLAASALLRIPKNKIRSESVRMAADCMDQCRTPPVAHTPVYDCVLILCNYLYLAHEIMSKRSEGRPASILASVSSSC